MAIDNEQWNRLASYLSGQLSDAEKKSIEDWIEASEENRGVLLEARKIWDSATVRLRYPEIDSTQLLADIKSEPRQSRLISLLDQPVWKIAASLTLILVSYFVIKSVTKENITIESGDEVATFYLPDSSKVWLNTNSQITYARKFTTRNVTLSGEAFLSVKKDTRDFIVTTENTITTVVGTAFNLKTSSDSSVILTVAEGIVKFSKADSINKETIVVKANELAVFKQKSRLTKRKNNDPSFAKWRELNNPAYEDEKINPLRFLSNNYTWRKNQINQSVIEGTLANSASLAAYTKIILNVTYTKPDGTLANVDIIINDTVYPGKHIQYRRRLLDLFSDTKSVVVELKSAEITTTKSF
jgi:transmembrane sensor